MADRIFELMAPCHFGMEAVLKREIDDLGYDILTWDMRLPSLKMEE